MSAIKIFAFNCPPDSNVPLVNLLRDLAQSSEDNKWISECETIQECDIALYPRKYFDPVSETFDTRALQAVETARKAGKLIIVDGAGSLSPPFPVPGVIALRRGLFRSRIQPNEYETPHFFSEETIQQLNACKIRTKGASPVIGFCGRAHAGKFSILQPFVPDIVLVAVLKTHNPNLLAEKVRGVCAFMLRARLLKPSMYRLCQTNFRETTGNYFRAPEDTKKAMRADFTNIMNNCDYALCVRGLNNSSIRYYETLAAGRIPVVIDTDVVCFKQERFHIKLIDLDDLDRIDEILAEDFALMTDSQYRQIQLHNKEQFKLLCRPNGFYKSLLQKTLAAELLQED